MKRYLASPLFRLEALAILIGLAVVVILSASIHPVPAKANQGTICYNYLNSTATTSKTYMTAGTATTTQTVTNCSDGNVSLDGGAVLLSAISSSTAPSIALRYEVSRDGIDFYPWSINTSGTVASSSLMTTGANEYKWVGAASSTDMAGTGIASSSAGTANNLRGSTFNLSLVLPATPFPYFRIKYYVPPGAPAVSFSAEVLVNKQQLAR